MLTYTLTWFICSTKKKIGLYGLPKEISLFVENIYNMKMFGNSKHPQKLMDKRNEKKVEYGKKKTIIIY